MSDYDPSKDPRSSNSLINAYLASKGLQPTGENVRRALEGNNANPGMIKGLVNSLPSTEAEDQAAMAAARGHGGSGLPTPPIPPGANRELPDSAGGSETRVGGTSAGGGAGGGGGGGPSNNTSAAPTGGGGGGAPSEDELTNALIAAAIGGGTGLGVNRMMQLWQNRSPSSAPATAAPEPPAGYKFAWEREPFSGRPQSQPEELPLTGGSGVAPPKQAELPLQGSGPRVNQPELSLTGGGGPRQGDLFTRPTTLPPSVPATPSPAPAPSQAITSPDALVDPELTRRLNAGTPVPGQPVPPQPIQSVEQFRAANPMTASVPAAEVAPTGTRAPRARVRAPRVKVPL